MFLNPFPVDLGRRDSLTPAAAGRIPQAGAPVQEIKVRHAHRNIKPSSSHHHCHPCHQHTSPFRAEGCGQQ